MTKPILITIAGSTGSGKSYLAHALKKEFGDNATLLCVDAYYRDQGHKPFEERTLVNYDIPTSIEHQLLLEHLQTLLSGKSITAPVYDYALHSRSDRTELISACSVVILEGIFALYWDEVLAMCDLKVFVETPLEVCYQRRLERDIATRGRDAQGVLKQWNKTVLPSYLEYCDPTKQNADVIVVGTDPIEKIINALRLWISGRL